MTDIPRIKRIGSSGLDRDMLARGGYLVTIRVGQESRAAKYQAAPGTVEQVATAAVEAFVPDRPALRPGTDLTITVAALVNPLDASVFNARVEVKVSAEIV
jgi:hypothetical protein